MLLLTWARVLPKGRRFPRDEAGKPYLPGDYLTEALKDAVVFYFVKKDRALESEIRRHLTSGRLEVETLSGKVYDMVFGRYPLLESLKVPDSIPLDEGGISTVTVEVLDLRKGYEVKDFRTEAYYGTLEVPVEVEGEVWDRLRYAGRSFTEALIKMERGLLEEHPLLEEFYSNLLNEVREWEVPIRVGRWTTAPHGGRLLFFWRIKEVRERILREYGVDIRPTKVLYLPRDRATAGWSEMRRHGA